MRSLTAVMQFCKTEFHSLVSWKAGCRMRLWLGFVCGKDDLILIADHLF